MEEKKSFARKFCPVIRLHKKEQYTPTNFIELFRNQKGEIDFTCSKPRKKWNSKAKFDNETGLRWFAPTAFVHFLEDKDIEIRFKRRRIPLIIQYLYYFAYNDYFWGDLRIPFLMHAHDWEIIQIAIEKLDDEYEILSYSISAHGTFLEIDDQKQILKFKETGFTCNRGAHNFASIFYQPSRPHKEDILIKPDTPLPNLNGNKIPLRDLLLFLDEVEREYLNKFSFASIIPPWKLDFYNSATWIPEFWSWSLNRQIKQLIYMIGRAF